MTHTLTLVGGEADGYSIEVDIFPPQIYVPIVPHPFAALDDTGKPPDSFLAVYRRLSDTNIYIYIKPWRGKANNENHP